MSDVGQLKAMLTRVFVKAAEARDKAAGKPTAARKAASPDRPAPGPSVRLSLTAVDDGPGRDDGRSAQAVTLADRLDRTMEAMGRDLVRLSRAFGMGEDAATAALNALTRRIDAATRRAALAAFESPADERRPMTGAGKADNQTFTVALRGIDLEVGLGRGGAAVSVEVGGAEVSMLRTVSAAAAGGRSIFAVLRPRRRPDPEPPGLTIRADGVAAAELDRVMAALAQAMSAAPPRLEGCATLIPCKAPAADGGSLCLTLDLAMPLVERDRVDRTEKSGRAERGTEVEEREFDVRI